MKNLLLLSTHLAFGAAGFALGIYVLPILTAPPAPSHEQVQTQSSGALFRTDLRSDLRGSDLLHWGEGTVSISAEAISLMGKLAPGPDYKLYLAPKMVEDEAEFLAVKADSLLIGDVKTFDNFIVPLGAGVDPAAYSAVVIWCETFGEFISAGAYR
jgi:hypothetical protein